MDYSYYICIKIVQLLYLLRDTMLKIVSTCKHSERRWRPNDDLEGRLRTCGSRRKTTFEVLVQPGQRSKLGQHSAFEGVFIKLELDQ